MIFNELADDIVLELVETVLLGEEVDLSIL
jgi:hypothetical protein